MAIFDDITLSWKGKDYVISSDDKIMKLLAKMEDIITFQEISEYCNTRSSFPMAKISEAFAVALNFAGAKVTSAEVYDGLFFDIINESTVALDSVMVLMQMMVPPSYIMEDEDQGNEVKNSQKTRKIRKEKRSKKHST